MWKNIPRLWLRIGNELVLKSKIIETIQNQGGVYNLTIFEEPNTFTATNS